MPLSVPRILVIDDNEEDGIKVAKSVWASKYAIRFIQYDQESLGRAGKENMRGVRIIFMDMDLIGDGILASGSKNFTAVQQVLQYCLDERNGPYVLITWSTFDAHAPELFKHLNERLPVSLRPSLCKQLNKEEYEDGDGKLTEKVREFMQELDAIGALILWEKSIQYAACETLYDLIDVALHSGMKNTKDALRGVLYSLARAEAEQNLDKENSVRHLYSVLSQILYDNLAGIRPEDDVALGELVYSGKNLQPKEQWSQKINAMLHLDLTNPDPNIGHTPGDVFTYPVKGHDLPIPEEDLDKFLRGNFMSLKKSEDSKKVKIKKACQLVLVEITPPCDYSQKKFVWHRYVVGALVPHDLVDLTRVMKRVGKREKRENRLPDFRWESSEFQIKDESPFRIIFNSRLIVSIPPKKEFQKKVGERLFRIRQPLLSDMIGWLSRQSSRQGHVSVA
jgi:hypothetical protein